MFAQCHDCHGNGTIEVDMCPDCQGTGKIDKDEYYDEGHDLMILTKTTIESKKILTITTLEKIKYGFS